MKNISSIVSELWLPGGTTIKASVSVSIIDKNNKYVLSRYENDYGEFLTSRPNPRFILKLQLPNQPWSPRNQVVLNQRYFGEFKNMVKSFYNHIQKGNNYIYNDEGLLVEVVKDETDLGVFRTDGQLFVLEPEVLSVNEQLNIPGIQMTFNEPYNTVIVSMDEFETLLSDIAPLNLYTAGMMTLLSHYSTSEIVGESIMKNYEEREVPKTNNSTDAKDIFAKSEQCETVTGTIIPKKPTSLFDI